MTNTATGQDGESLLSHLTAFVNLVLAGKVPTSVRHIYSGASLTTLNKPDGSICPIAVGLTLRRLVCKVASQAIRDDLSSMLRPIQLGFGTSHGAEAAVHATRYLAPDEIVVKLDIANAFRRDKILDAVLEIAPQLAQLVFTSYSSESSLFWGEDIIPSAEGIQQGDPLVLVISV